MRVIDQSFEVLSDLDREKMLCLIEKAGRVCYKSEDKITTDSASGFVRRTIKSGHESVIEHGVISIRFITDRGVTHELVRHRLASFSQESTRYCNYGLEKFGSDLTFIRPAEYDSWTDQQKFHWVDGLEQAEKHYFRMLESGCVPQQARAVLPNSLKTEIVVTANLREWRHIFKLRTSKRAHPDIRLIMRKLYNTLRQTLPEIFEDIVVE